jgi:hypothetical protein
VVSKNIQQPLGRSGAAPGKIFTKIYSGNIVEHISFTDTLGNTGSTTLDIGNIDTTPPVCGNRTYYPTTPTSGNVLATLSGSMDGESGILTGGGDCVLTGNAITCSVPISDRAGNQVTCTSSTVSTIDRIPPTCSVMYSAIAPTNQPVMVTLT